MSTECRICLFGKDFDIKKYNITYDIIINFTFESENTTPNQKHRWFCTFFFFVQRMVHSTITLKNNNNK